MQDRRSFIIGGVAVGALVAFEPAALAVPAEHKPTQAPAGWRVYHERPDGVVTVFADVTELGGPPGGPISISFDDDLQRFLLPPGHFWMERGGYTLLSRQPC